MAAMGHRASIAVLLFAAACRGSAMRFEETLGSEVASVSDRPHGSCVFTIGSWNNYGFIKHFFEQVEATNPEVDILAWVVADNPSNPDPDVKTIRAEFPTRWRLVVLSDLQEHLGGASVEELSLRYGISEFNTVIKPAAFLYLFQNLGMKQVMFFDNDIWVMRSLGPLMDKLSTVSFLFTPHLTKPYPIDGKKQDERSIMLAGQMNLGFGGVSNTKRSMEILRWWSDRLRYYGFAQPELGMHFDQNWINMVVSYCDQSEYIIERDPIWNVAYWNLHYRAAHLSHTSDGHYYYDGRPLGFVHFSGMSDLSNYNIDTVSPHQGRLKMDDISPVVRQLFVEYLRRLTNSSAMRWRHISFGYPALPDLLQPHWNWMHDPENFNDERSRRVRTNAARSPFRLLPPPRNEASRIDHRFLPQSVGEYFLEGVHDQVVSGVGGWIPEVIWQIYTTRPDLQEAFPDALGRDRQGLLDWFCDSNTQRELKLPASWAAAVKAARARKEKEAAAKLPFGVNVIGWFAGTFGVAESARLVWYAARAAGLDGEANFLPTRIASAYDDWDYKSAPNISRSGAFYFNILVANADFANDHLDTVYPKSDWNRHFNIGYWAWELQDFPSKWAATAKLFHEIWTPSEFVTKAVEKTLRMKGVETPVKTINFGLPVTPEMVNGKYQGSKHREEIDAVDAMFKIPADTLSFLVHFDFLSCFQRKNVIAAISAFRFAFQDIFGKGDGGTKKVLLLVKADNAHFSSEFEQELDEIRNATGGHASIRVVQKKLKDDSWNRLLPQFDIYVSLHRSEGYGLLLLRMMMMGKPVIATNYSGNVDFMAPVLPPALQFTLVNWSYVAVKNVGSNFEAAYANSSWANPDVMAAAGAMRKFYDNPQLLIDYRDRVAPLVRKQFSSEGAGNRMAERLRMLYAKQGEAMSRVKPSKALAVAASPGRASA